MVLSSRQTCCEAVTFLWFIKIQKTEACESRWAGTVPLQMMHNAVGIGCLHWVLLGSSCRHLPEEPNLPAVLPENLVLEDFSSTTTYSFVHHTHVFVDDVSHSFNIAPLLETHLLWMRGLVKPRLQIFGVYSLLVHEGQYKRSRVCLRPLTAEEVLNCRISQFVCAKCVRCLWSYEYF